MAFKQDKAQGEPGGKAKKTRRTPNLDKNWARITTGGSTKQGNQDRIKVLDGYNTPPIATEELLKRVYLPLRVWEPANGNDFMSNVLEARGHRVFRSDIFLWSKRTNKKMDFTAEDAAPPTAWHGKSFSIVSNPPFSKGRQFVERGMDLLPVGGHLCLLLRLQFLESQGRKLMFERYPPLKVSIFSKRLPRMHRFDSSLDKFLKAKEADGERAAEPGSALAFAWFIWRKERTDKAQRAIKPTLEWI